MKECKVCLELKTAFYDAKCDPHKNLHHTYDLMRKLYDQRKLALYMSDCSFENWYEELEMEIHYTYNVYLECRRCKRVYRLGVCIRGAPVYEVLDKRPDKNEFWRRCLRDHKKFYDGRYT